MQERRVKLSIDRSNAQGKEGGGRSGKAGLGAGVL